MKRERLEEILEQVADGSVPVRDAVDQFRSLPFRDLGHTRIDTHRPLRTGQAEVVFGAGKRPDQLVEIVEAIIEEENLVLVTRLTPEGRQALESLFPEAQFDDDAGTMVWGEPPAPRGRVAVLCAGTSDIPVAAEAAVTATTLGSSVSCFWDVGVAGLHRLLSVQDELADARAVVVVAGMEGALPSVVGGIVQVPVVAVPTSVGYGASFGGLTALLGMLNSCAPGVAAVNIDNGFGAGYLAHLINATSE